DEIVVDLPRAADESAYLLASLRRDRIVDHRTERPRGQLLQLGRGRREAEQRLRLHEDQRPLRARQSLASQDMEVLLGARGVGDDEISLRAELEVALEASARVLGALTLEAVRKQ